jgi:hypothetical protein
LQLHALHERMANLGSLAAASGNLRKQCLQLRTNFLDNPTREFSLGTKPRRLEADCIVLYSIVLYCIVLYCIVLYCIVLYCIVLYALT